VTGYCSLALECLALDSASKIVVGGDWRVAAELW